MYLIVFMAYIGEIMAMNAKHSAQNQDDSTCLRRDDPMPVIVLDSKPTVLVETLTKVFVVRSWLNT